MTRNDLEVPGTEIDETDRKILSILQADGRTALSEIARRLDMGAATIHERTNDLEENGYIREYRAMLDPEMMGFDEVAFVKVHTEGGRFSAVGERLAEEDGVHEVHETTGDADLLLKVRVRHRSELTSLLADIGAYDGVETTSTNVALRTVAEENKLDLSE